MGDRRPGVEVPRTDDGSTAPGRWCRARCGATS